MFDFEIAEDARLCAEAVARNAKRERPWHPPLEGDGTRQTTVSSPKPT